MEDEKLLSLFTDMARNHTSYVERRLQPLGIHAGQGAILTALGEHGPCTQKELAEYRRVSAATISVMLRRMEKGGLIVRTASNDGKGNRIDLTDAGSRMYRELARDRIGESERMFAGLTAAELSAAEKIFQTISRNMEETNAPK